MYKLLKYYSPGYDRQLDRDDKFAREHIAGNSSDEFRKQAFWPLLEKNLEKGKTYLDAGCGIGGWIIFLTEEGYNVEGIDIAARTVRALTEYNRDLQVKIAGMTQIPYQDESLDGVLAIGAVEYVEDKVPAALTEVRRVLKPGGLFFLEVPVANALRRLLYIPLKELEKIFRKSRGEQPTFANYLFTREDLQKQLQNAGFSIEVIQPHELPDTDQHYGLWVDWKILRGKEPYDLNLVGRLVKVICNAISPWIASTGAVVVAKKRKM